MTGFQSYGKNLMPVISEFATAEDHANLQKEIALMKGLGRHRNIVSMVACVSRGPTICLVMDYCSHGDLRLYLRNLRKKVGTRSSKHHKVWPVWFPV